jgi:hypothetical protein
MDFRLRVAKEGEKSKSLNMIHMQMGQQDVYMKQGAR